MYDLESIRPTPLREMARLGDPNDGGYVIPETCIKESRTLVSLGLAHNWSFDDRFTAENHAFVIGVDGSLTAWGFVRRAIQKFRHGVGYLLTLEFTKARQRIARSRNLLRWGYRFFIRPSDATHRMLKLYVSSRVGEGYVSLAELLAGRPHAPLAVFLKMDIEGSEYEVIPEICSVARIFNGLAIEFHELGSRGEEFAAAIQALKQSFTIVHVHANNIGGVIADTDLPVTLEITFLNSALLGRNTVRTPFPSFPLAGLDEPCSPKRPDLRLAFRAG